MDSEKIATNHVELAISKTGHLVSHINSNDKEPSWDGDVEVYKKSGHVHAKADLILKVPVQVKGHIKPNLKKKSIKYSIQYSDFIRGFLSYFRNPLSSDSYSDSLQQKCLFPTSGRISLWFSHGKPHLCPDVRGKSIIKGRSNHSLCNL